MPERDIESLGVMGWGVGWGWEILPSSPPSPPPNVWKTEAFLKIDEKHAVLSSNSFISVLNFLCIPQIGRLSAHGANVKRLPIPRIVLLSGLMRIEEIEKAFLTEISRSTESYGKIWCSRRDMPCLLRESNYRSLIRTSIVYQNHLLFSSGDEF